MGRRFVQMKDGTLYEVPKDYEAPRAAAPAVAGDLPGYLSHATGKWVEGRVQREADLAASGCRPFEGAESEAREVARHKEYAQQARDRAVEKQLADILPHMSREVRGALLHNDVPKEFNERAARQRAEIANRRG